MPTSTAALVRPNPQIRQRRLDVVAMLATLVVAAVHARRPQRAPGRPRPGGSHRREPDGYST